MPAGTERLRISLAPDSPAKHTELRIALGDDSPAEHTRLAIDVNAAEAQAALGIQAGPLPGRR